ncbi:hypothetical protein BKK56_05920 [Rodentibacter genomosp. 2]|nr:hypothetical protein BKK56_05920 [Rodentibacter genomosp. 2]
MKNSLYKFIYVFIIFFVSLSLTIVILSFTLDLFIFVFFNGKLFEGIPVGIFIGNAIGAFFLSLYYLWHIKKNE